MYIRCLALAAVICLIPSTSIADTDTDIAANEPETITRRADLAVYLGLSANDVVFGEPRNFRSESMNNFPLEPLNEAEEP